MVELKSKIREREIETEKMNKEIEIVRKEELEKIKEIKEKRKKKEERRRRQERD